MSKPVAIAGAVLVGVLTALQARINGGLGAALGDGITAAVVSFASGFAILVVLAAALPAGRAATRRLVSGVRGGGIRWWTLLGGLAGALTVATQGLTVATIGVALFTVGVVAGQTVGGLALDRAGYGPAGVVPVTARRLTGAALVLVAVAIGLAGEGPSSVPWWMLLLPFLAGAGISWQQATNGRLRARADSALIATLVNFAGGTLVLVAALAVRIAVAGAVPLVGAPWWLYLGGANGVVYIFLSAALVRTTGVLLLGLGSVVGLLAASIVLDAVAPPSSAPPVAFVAIATVVALVGVLVVAARRPRPPSHRESAVARRDDG